MAKDPLCPLGFHPQVRWPTRCKRCFREFKEHTVNKDAEYSIRSRLGSEPRTISPAVSIEEAPPPRPRTPSSGSTSSTTDENRDFSSPYSSISSTALNRLNKYREGEPASKRPSSVSVVSESLTLPSGDGPLVRRRRTTDLTDGNESTSSTYSGNTNSTETVTIRLRKGGSFGSFDDSSSDTSPSSSSPSPRLGTSPTPKTTDADAMPAPEQGKKESASTDSTTPKPKKTKKKRLLIQGVQEVTPATPPDSNNANEDESSTGDSSADVAFIIQVKSTGKKKKLDDDDETMSMTTATDTTETTLVDLNEMVTGGMSSWEVEDMKVEVKRLREKCDKLEKEKAEILTRRVASLDAPRAQSTEYVKLQQKVNQLTSLNEDLKDEQKHLESRVRELESDLSNRPTTEFMQRSMAELRSKLSTSESQVDQLQEEKRDAIRQMNDMQEEFEEMQDSFREEQAEEFASLKKELDDASKNCRLLQFKLRKVEKRSDQLVAEKKEIEQRLETSSNSAKVAKLEDELKKAKLENERLMKCKDTLGVTGLKKKSPVLTKAPSGEKVEPPMPPDFDPHKTLRDLQSALERESDSREQLKFAEEEAGTLRQKISRIEDENESLLIQIKKMSSKSRTDLSKGRVESGRLGQPPPTENGEKVDPLELKLQLELNEQESKILRKKVEELEMSNTKLSKDLQKAEDKMQTLEHASPITKSKNVEEVSLLRRKLIEKEREIERLQTEMLSVTTKNKGKMFKSKSLEVQESNMRLDVETKAELKKVQDELTKLTAESEKQRTCLEDELSKAQHDVDNHQLKVQQMGESNKSLLEQIENLRKDLKIMRDHYESVQKEVVTSNSKLSTEKEEREAEKQKLRRDHDTIDRELRTLRETFNNRQDTWIKEKLTLEQKVREVEVGAKKLMSISGDRDANKLKNLLKEQQADLDTRTRELTECQDRIVQMQKDNEVLKQQLEDFDKVAQVQLRSLNTDTSRKSDKDIKELQEKLVAEQKIHKTEIAQMKMKQDQQIAVKAEEISTVQSQLSRAKRERDTYRQMVDSAQRAIAELKSRGSQSGGQRGPVSGLEEAATGAQAAVNSLQDRIASLEDELSEARRDTSHVKTEMVTEKSQWEMKIGELQQKINELEEERLLSGSGRVRGSSVLSRTRLELAWQKEREEQQRRLKEATTLARDLKTTLLEIERERDRDKMEAKRRVEQLKSTMEEEQEDVKRKLGESQCDLLELRDAHAKLRTANEKLRKDREKLETQREAQIRKELEVRKVRLERDKILDQLISRVSALNPTASNSNLAQSAPKMNFAEILHFLQNMKSLAEPEDITNPREKRRSHFKKATSLGEGDGPDLPKSRESLASMPGGSYGLSDHYGVAGRGQKPYLGSVSSSTLTLPSRARGPGDSSSQIRSNASDSGGSSAATFNPKGSLYRKALSLEQTVSMPDEQKIWKGVSEAGSGSSITSIDGQYSRGSSIERMSTISTKSDKPKGLVNKMKNLVKSKSIEESSATATNVMRAGVQAGGVASNAGSDLSINEEKDTKTLKDKVKGMFKRSSRSPSVERKAPASTLQFQPTRPSREPTPQRDAREGTPGNTSTQRPLMSTQRPLMPSQNFR